MASTVSATAGDVPSASQRQLAMELPAPTTTTTIEPDEGPSPVITVLDETLRNDIANVARSQGVKASVGVYDQKLGKSWTTDTEAASDVSSAKIALIEAVLMRRQADGKTISGSERELAGRLLGTDDAHSGNELLKNAGGTEGLKEFYKRIGADFTANNIGDTWQPAKTNSNDRLKIQLLYAFENSQLNVDNREVVRSLLVANAKQGSVLFAGLDTGIATTNLVSTNQTDGVWQANGTGSVSSPSLQYVLSISVAGATTAETSQSALTAVADTVNKRMALQRY